jgi:hypothetical protein
MMVEDKIKNLDTAAFATLIGWTVEEVRNRFKELSMVRGDIKIQIPVNALLIIKKSVLIHL